MLTTFAGPRVIPGTVTVILTGDEKAKARFASRAWRKACRDSNDLRSSDPPGDARWPWYALDWGDYVGWDGRGALPARIADQLRTLVARVHQIGRKLRLYGLPERKEAWSAALDAGVDLVGTDHLSEFHAFLRSRGAPAAIH